MQTKYNEDLRWVDAGFARSCHGQEQQISNCKRAPQHSPPNPLKAAPPGPDTFIAYYSCKPQSRATHKNQMPFRISYITGIFFLFKHFNWMIVSMDNVQPASHVLKDRLSPASSEVENDQEKTEEILGSRHRQGPGQSGNFCLVGCSGGQPVYCNSPTQIPSEIVQATFWTCVGQPHSSNSIDQNWHQMTSSLLTRFIQMWMPRIIPS